MKFEITKEWLLNGEDLDGPEPDFSAGDPSTVRAWLNQKIVEDTVDKLENKDESTI